jgi:hypothetical protein
MVTRRMPLNRLRTAAARGDSAAYRRIHNGELQVSRTHGQLPHPMHAAGQCITESYISTGAYHSKSEQYIFFH